MIRSLIVAVVAVFGLSGCFHSKCCYSPNVSKYPSAPCCPQGNTLISNASPAVIVPGGPNCRP